MKTTMRDLAEACGYSKSTVSLALKNAPKIPEKTRKHIHKIAKKIGYKKDARMSEYMSYMGKQQDKRNGSVIAMLSFLESHNQLMSHSHARAFYTTVKMRADQLGYGIDCFYTRSVDFNTKHFESVLSARNIDCLIIAPSGYREKLKHMNFDKYATAMCLDTLEYPKINRTEPDYFRNTLHLLKEIYKLGYRRITTILSPDYSKLNSYSTEAAISFFREKHPDATIHPVNKFIDQKSKSIQTIIERENPDVVISNIMEGYNLIHESGYKVPEDIGYAQLTINTNISGTIDSEKYIETKSLSGIDILSDVLDASVVDMVVSQAHTHSYGIPKNPHVRVIEGKWKKGKTLRAQ